MKLFKLLKLREVDSRHLPEYTILNSTLKKALYIASMADKILKMYLPDDFKEDYVERYFLVAAVQLIWIPK